ncbi:hypothetical protein AVEN_31604-1 [Araneus ventricosus]|uniref:Uncharacterized protein n=1 Tax=Araneus ventricosus TaxID=182803 RepID=A0A4Y2SXG1_ARAVE|nr:hypothetical protein AVEN_31604-1 [Araneus ventricosus]
MPMYRNAIVRKCQCTEMPLYANANVHKCHCTQVSHQQLESHENLSAMLLSPSFLLPFRDSSWRDGGKFPAGRTSCGQASLSTPLIGRNGRQEGKNNNSGQSECSGSLRPSASRQQSR